MIGETPVDETIKDLLPSGYNTYQKIAKARLKTYRKYFSFRDTPAALLLNIIKDSLKEFHKTLEEDEDKALYDDLYKVVTDGKVIDKFRDEFGKELDKEVLRLEEALNGLQSN